jgi:hypothetical protein
MMRVVLVAGGALFLLVGAAQSARRTAPSNTSPPTISGKAEYDSEQTASPGSWSGSDPKSYIYQWQRCDADGSNCVNFGEARTKNTYNTDVKDSNHRLRVVVTASNSDGSASATSAPTAVIAGESPQNTSLPTISGTAMEGETLTATPGTWTGPGPISYTYEWRHCKHPDGTGCEPDSSTGPTLVLTIDDVGKWMVVVVGARSSKGRGSAKSAPTAAVAPKGSAPPKGSLPVSSAPPVINGIAREGEVLTATPGTWTNAPTSFVYSWNRCDASGNNCVVFATGTQVKLTVTDVGHRIRMFVEAKNASGSTTVTSAATAVVVPSTTVTTVTPTAPKPPAAPTAPKLPTGAIKLSSGEISLPVSRIALPVRLVISRVRFTPTRITRHHAFVGRFRVTDTRGFVVRGALVYAVGMPKGWVRTTRKVVTGRNGWAQFTFRPKRAMPHRRGSMYLLLRARKPGDSLLAGVSSRRLVQIKIR